MNREKIIEQYKTSTVDYFNEIGVDYGVDIIEKTIATKSYEAKTALRELLGSDNTFIGESASNVQINVNELLNNDNIFIEYLDEKRTIIKQLLRLSINGRTITNKNTDELEYCIGKIEANLTKMGNTKYVGRMSQMIKTGSKLSKLIAKIVQEDVVNVIYSKKIQEAKPLKVFIGIRPTDFLSMSDGNSWSSCHSIKGQGCYQTGGMSLANDPYTIIAWAGDPLRKEWRQTFYVDPSQKLIVSSRSYPTINESASEMVKAYLKKLVFTEPEEEIMIARNQNVPKYLETSRDALFYNDVLEGSYQGTFALYAKSNVPEAIYLGGESYCPICGNELDDVENIYCCQRNHYTSCDYCADGLSEDEVYWAEDGSYCESCFYEEFFHCDDCGEATHHDDRFHETEDDMLCRYCAEDHYQKCSISGKWDLKHRFARLENGRIAIYLHVNTIMKDSRLELLQEFVYEPNVFRARGYHFTQQKSIIENHIYLLGNSESVELNGYIPKEQIFDLIGELENDLS